MAHSIIGEEKAEQASNKPALDLKVEVTDNTFASAPEDHPTSNAFSTPVEENHFEFTNPVDTQQNGQSEQDKILKHQQEVENNAVQRSTEDSKDIPIDSTLHKIAGEVETDQII